MDILRNFTRAAFGMAPVKIAGLAIVALAVSGPAFLGIARATDSPTFCGSVCHEMAPFHQAWVNGGHKDIACVQCHVDPGVTASLAHKFVALHEVMDHVKGGVRFPLAAPPDVPDARCVRCHQTVAVKIPGFSHAQHAKRGPCMKCHPDAGHSVTNASLQKAGLLGVAYTHSAESSGTTATIGGGKADLAGHVAVACSRCHDMAATPCSACHTPTRSHENRPTDCTVCHATGAKFVFTHPIQNDCGSCHTPTNPAHSPITDCTLCHLSTPGVDWDFTHPIQNDCGTCHKPTNPTHTTVGTCTNCHQNPGKSWAFTHPGRGANCTSCHTPKASHHHSGTCSTCHRNPGKSWAFTHPGRGADCRSCHSPKASHNHSGTCSTCHQSPGKSWAFTHPGATSNCASCHTRPSNHSSGQCSTCHHNAGASFAFTHPSVRGMPNSESIPCAQCHPNGAPAYYCTCHGNKTGPSGD